MGFHVFHTDLFIVSAHFESGILARLGLKLSLRVVGNFKTWQLTPEKQINAAVTFSTDDTFDYR